ncbi:transposase [Salinibacter grassmerensis]|uniref:transposase n=1 Tax=Salinibacter grassmerensis TaxID=3040353 RepID=UPI003C6E31FE
MLRPGQKADLSEAEALIEGCRFEALIADKGFDSNDFIKQVESLEMVVVIPPRKTESSSERSTAPPTQIATRSNGSLAGSRTRYEKTDRNYSCFLYFASIVTWLL